MKRIQRKSTTPDQRRNSGVTKPVELLDTKHWTTRPRILISIQACGLGGHSGTVFPNFCAPQILFCPEKIFVSILIRTKISPPKNVFCTPKPLNLTAGPCRSVPGNVVQVWTTTGSQVREGEERSRFLRVSKEAFRFCSRKSEKPFTEDEHPHVGGTCGPFSGFAEIEGQKMVLFRTVCSSAVFTWFATQKKMARQYFANTGERRRSSTGQRKKLAQRDSSQCCYDLNNGALKLVAMRHSRLQARTKLLRNKHQERDSAKLLLRETHDDHSWESADDDYGRKSHTTESWKQSLRQNHPNPTVAGRRLVL